jgi:hypothetical protein
MDGWSDEGCRKAGSKKLEEQGQGQSWLAAITWVGHDPTWVVAPGSEMKSEYFNEVNNFFFHLFFVSDWQFMIIFIRSRGYAILDLEGPGSNSGTLLANLWWSRCHWDSFFSSHFSFPVCIAPSVPHSDPLIHYRRHTIAASDSVGD